MAQPGGATTMVSLNLRAWRQRKLLTQNELSARAGVSVATISAVECGKHVNLGIGTIRKLAHALDVEPDHVDEFRRRMSFPDEP